MKSGQLKLALLAMLAIAGTASAGELEIKSSQNFPADSVSFNVTGEERSFPLSDGNATIAAEEFVGEYQIIQEVSFSLWRGGNAEDKPIVIQVRRCGAELCRKRVYVAYVGAHVDNYSVEKIDRLCSAQPSAESAVIESYIYCRRAFGHLKAHNLLHWKQAETAAVGWFDNAYRLATLRDQRTRRQIFFYERDPDVDAEVQALMDSRGGGSLSGRPRGYFVGMIAQLDVAESEKIQLADDLIMAGDRYGAINMAYEARAAVLKLAGNDPAKYVNGISANDITARIARWQQTGQARPQPGS